MTGYIYILTNPSFPQYGKLGYATDVKQRLAELNRSTAVPFAFRVYATYEVDSALSDKEAPLHSGQAEPRSAFCRRSGRQAPHPGILCHAAGGHLRDPRGDRGDQRLPPPSEKMEGDDNSAEDEALARQIEEQHRERVSPFAFSKCGISEGAELEFCCRGNEQPASAAPSPTTSMCAFRTKYGPWPHWRSICWGPGIRSPGLSISNTTARG